MTDTFDFDRFVALPRLSGMRCAPDGSRLVVCVETPAPDGKKLRSAIWEIDPLGRRAPRRLTRSGAGESNAAFLPDGALIFTSARAGPPDTTDAPKEEEPALWLLPVDGGEARRLLAPQGGVDAVRTARDTRTLLFTACMHRDAGTLEADALRIKARTDAGVSALLFDAYPIRHWDHYIGPRERHLMVTTVPDDETGGAPAPRDLTPDAGPALEEHGFDISPDGTIAVASMLARDIRSPAADLVVFDVASGERRTLTAGDASYDQPAFAPDGRSIACVRTTRGDPETAGEQRLWLIDLADGRGRDLAPSADLWPECPTWSPDGSAVFFLADRDGAGAIFRVHVASGEVTCLAADGSFGDACPSPDGSSVFALRSTLRVPNQVVRLDARTGSRAPVVLLSPGLDDTAVGAPGLVERIEATAQDGARIAAWLVLPPDASSDHPAPLVVFVHGGPLGSWTNGWHWRWNPQLLVARGYAVLLPDPAFSLGYGQAFVQRGWGRWHEAPYTDVLAAADAAASRPDIDESRQALMGGSFGGYMANWVAGHTDRFRCVVTHASLWELRGFHGTTDDGNWWEFEFGDPYLDPHRYIEQSPSNAVASIRTPMLVIHGELDHRVPISEALRLWTDLQRHGVESKFLYFPDENHWVLKPQNARLWYETVLAFLDQHVLGKAWVRPALL